MISEISPALLLCKMELFKTNTEKQDCTLKGNTAQHYLYLWKSNFFLYSQIKFIILASPHVDLLFSNSQGDKIKLKYISEYADSSLTLT